MNHVALSAQMGVGESALTAVLGYGVVFVGLVLLMCVVIIMGKVMASKKAQAEAPAHVPSPVPFIGV